MPGHKGPLELVWKFAFNLSQDSALHVRFDCLETSFVFCLDWIQENVKAHHSGDAWWIYVSTFTTKKDYTKLIEHLEKIQVSQDFLCLQQGWLTKKKKFPISHLQGLRLLFTFSICSQSPLWDTLTCGGTKRGRQEHRNVAKTRRQWNSVETSWGTHLILQFAPQLAILMSKK